MKKAITNNKLLNELVSALDGINNTVPYNMKRVFNFKGRKSPDIAQTAISILTNRDAIIYDPFAGSGSFVMASVKANRKIVATEIDNYTYSAVYTLLHDSDIEKLNSMFETIKNTAKSEIMELYTTSCCGIKNYISKLFFDPENEEYFNPTPNRDIIDGENIRFISKCPICNKNRKKFDEDDRKQLDFINRLNTSNFPHCKYIENSRINITSSTGADYYDRIFTKRSQKALLILQDAILKLPSSVERDVLEHSLVSALSLARISMYGSSTDILYHVVTYGAQESNVWELFESKYKSFIEFKSEYKDILSTNPQKNDRYEMYLSSYQDFCKEQKLTECFDLIYTDFPYTDQVPYLERNQLYRIWLNTFYKKGEFELTSKMLHEEIVQTNAPERIDKQDIHDYYSDLDKMFAAFYKILKDKSLLIFTVKLGKSKYFSTLLEIINLARKNGFEYAMRFGIDKNDPTIRKQSAYKNTLSNEMIIAFEKLDNTNRYWYVGNRNYEFETTKIVYNYIKKSKFDVNMSSAVNFVKQKLFKEQSYIATENDLEKIHSIIKENFLIEPSSAIIRIDCNRLYLDIEENTDLFTKIYEYVPVIIRALLEEKGKFTLDDLYFEIANALCNGNPETINQFLESSTYSNDIKKLLENYCNTTGKVYTKKSYTRARSNKAIDISTLDGTSFELVIKRLLEAQGFLDVINTGGSGDLGVDLLAKKYDENGYSKLYLFQCKRWASNVGSEPMQRLVAERSRRNADVAICVTTSDFTKDGELISKDQGIGMWNGEFIIRELNFYFPNEYYNAVFE